MGEQNNPLKDRTTEKRNRKQKQRKFWLNFHVIFYVFRVTYVYDFEGILTQTTKKIMNAPYNLYLQNTLNLCLATKYYTEGFFPSISKWTYTNPPSKINPILKGNSEIPISRNLYFMFPTKLFLIAERIL